MRARRAVPVLYVVLLAAAVAAPLAAQDDEDEFTRVRRDQERVVARLSGLREKMERLAGRYEDEGRSRNAILLREAIARFDGQQALDLAREVERNLEQSMLSSIERQDELIALMESMYSVLRDRRDVEDMQSQAELARQGAVEMGYLAENQRKLLNATRALTDRPEELLEQAEELAERLATELDETERALASAEQAQGLFGEAALADELARRERTLAGAAEPTADAQERLQSDLAQLRERLGDGAALGDDELARAASESREAAGAAAARAAALMEQARRLLETAERGGEGAPGGREQGEHPGTRPGETGASGAARPGGAQAGGAQPGEAQAGQAQAGEAQAGEAQAGEAQAGAAGEARDGKPAATGSAASGEQPAGDAGGGEPRRDGSSSQPGESRAGGSQAEAEQTGGSGTGGSQSGEPRTGAPQSGESPAGESQTGASQPADEDSPMASAREAMEGAARELDAVRDALERAERSLAAVRNRDRSEALVAARDALSDAQDIEQLSERLEALDPEAGPELLDRTRELIEELTRVPSEVEAGDVSAARSASAAARLDLAALIEMLQRRAAAQAGGPAGAEPTQAQLDDLAARQDELREQTRELMARLSELSEPSFQPSMERAEQSMSRAGSALRSGDSEEAQRREEEAAEELEQARAELEQDRERYEQLRQEEVLFRLGEELTGLVEEQRAVNEETAGIDGGRGDDERLGRSQRRAIARLAGVERELAERTDTLRAALAEDGAVAFVFSLEQSHADMLRVADMLAAEQTGFVVRSLQDDVLRRLTDLLAVLEQERERRGEALRQEQTGEAPPGQTGEQPLVPPVAELYLIQRLEQMALDRLERFERLNPEIYDEDLFGDVERELLARWAFEHERVRELFESLAPEPPEAAGPGTEGGSAEGEESDPLPWLPPDGWRPPTEGEPSEDGDADPDAPAEEPR